MITYVIVLISLYSIVQFTRFIFIKLEGIDNSPKKLELNSYSPKTINSEIGFRDITLSLLLAMISLILGSITGAVASAIYQAPERDVFKKLAIL